MKCKKFKRSISLYLDGRLGEADEKALRGHLSECPRCAKTLAALQSAQESARAGAEPEAEYWDTFSRRVMHKIDAREKQQEGFGLRRLAAVFFPPSSRRLRIAAGVASVAVVIAVGVIFVEREGERVIPPPLTAPVGQGEATAEREKAPAETQEAPATVKDIADAKSEAAKTAVRTEAAPKPVEATVIPSQAETGDTRKKSGSEVPEVSEKGEVSPPPEAKATSKAITEGTPVETPAETRGASEKAADVAEAKKSDQKPKALQRAPEGEAPAPAKMERSTVESFSIVEKDAERPSPVVFNLSGGPALHKIADEDTSIADDELRRIIATWKTHIENNPSDSLVTEGYQQVATAYVLLAARTQDEALIAEGAGIIRKYLARAEDPALREFLTAKLKEIERSKEK